MFISDRSEEIPTNLALPYYAYHESAPLALELVNAGVRTAPSWRTATWN